MVTAMPKVAPRVNTRCSTRHLQGQRALLRRSCDSMLLHELGYGSTACAERIPDRCAPGIDGLVARRTRGSSHHLKCGDGTSLARQREGRPALAALTEHHVNPLYLPPREAPFDMEAQADKGERQ